MYTQYSIPSCLHAIIAILGFTDFTESEVSVTIRDDKLIHIIPDYYVSYTLDIANFYQNTPVNLSSFQFQYMAKPLSPAILRIGGTEADYTYYFNTDDGNCTDVPSEYNCFTKSYLEMLMDFVSATDTKLLFGLSAGYPNYPKRHNHVDPPSWNDSNTRSFLEYIVDHGFGDRFYGFELGNELNGDTHPSWQIDAIQRLKKLLNEIYGGKGLKMPIIAGPDTHSYTLRKGDDKFKWITDFINGSCSLVDVFTYHSYVNINSTGLLTVDGLNEQYVESKRFGDAANTFCANGSQLVFAGESAEHNGGGTDGVTNVYEDALWYLDALGTLPVIKQDALIRQQIWGMEYHAPYSLMNGPEYTPLPDYWIALLFNQLMGRRVLNATSTDSKLRVYAHCYNTNDTQDESVVMAFINIHDHEKALHFDSDSLGMKHDDYMMTPKDGNVSSKDILLNGNKISMTVNGKLPILKAVESEKNPIEIEAYSVGFVHFTDAKLNICGSQKN